MNIVTFLMVPPPLCIIEKRRKRPWKDDFWKFKELRYSLNVPTSPPLHHLKKEGYFLSGERSWKDDFWKSKELFYSSNVGNM